MKTSFLPTHLAAVTAVFAILAGAALAQAPAPGAPAAPGAAPAAPTEKPKPLSPTDKKFVKDAGKSIYYQLQLAEAAKTNYSDPQKPLARVRGTTATDLNKAWASLSKFAKEHGETLPAEVTGGDKSEIEKLGKLKEDKFDKQWVAALSKEAKHLTQQFELGGKTLQDPDLKMFATNYTPIVKNVFTSAEAAEKGLNAKKK